MELLALKENVLKLFGTDIEGLGASLKAACMSQDERTFDRFCELVEGDLTEDWMQKIYQYYLADRKEKMQDYTPKCLAQFLAMLAGDAEEIVDLCAGSGALIIQRWNRNRNQKFRVYELDENVIPFLIFNLAVRNIEALVNVGDVLQGEITEVYAIRKGNKYGNVTRIKPAL